MVNQIHNEPQSELNEKKENKSEISAYGFKTAYQAKAEHFNAEVTRNSSEIRQDSINENEKDQQESSSANSNGVSFQTLRKLLIGHV